MEFFLFQLYNHIHSFFEWCVYAAFFLACLKYLGVFQWLQYKVQAHKECKATIKAQKERQKNEEVDDTENGVFVK